MCILTLLTAKCNIQYTNVITITILIQHADVHSRVKYNLVALIKIPINENWPRMLSVVLSWFKHNLLLNIFTNSLCLSSMLLNKLSNTSCYKTLLIQICCFTIIISPVQPIKNALTLRLLGILFI